MWTKILEEFEQFKPVLILNGKWLLNSLEVIFGNKQHENTVCLNYIK